MGKLRIISYNNEIFEDRREAGRLLAAEFGSYRGQNVVVLGIPRGGMVVADEIAKELNVELDIVISRKLRTPGQEELAMGSVAENGKVFLNENIIRELGIDEASIKREKEVQLVEIARRSAVIRKVKAKADIKNRIAIVTDDGVATGATTQAALWAVRQEKPLKLIAAIPVGAEDTIRRLADEVDEIVCLRAPSFFSAVGQFYRFFGQVDDTEVLQILAERHNSGVVSSS